MEFDLQTFLTDMRRELNEKIDGVVSTLGDHETRITIGETTRRNVRWLIGIVLVALMAFLGDAFFMHHVE